MAGCTALGGGVPSLWSACSLYTSLPYGYSYRLEGVGRRGRPGGGGEYYQGSYGEYYEDQFYYYEDYYEDYDKKKDSEMMQI